VSFKDHHGHNFPAGKPDKGFQGFIGKKIIIMSQKFLLENLNS